MPVWKKEIAFGETVIRKTIRHVDCEILAAATDGRCGQCKKYRATLRAMYHRQQHPQSSTEDRTEVASRVNDRYLSTPEKAQKLKNYKAEMKSAKQEVAKMQKILDVSLATKGMELDTGMHNDLVTIMQEQSSEVGKAFPNNSFRQLFWQQQLEAALKKNPKQMRWHPLMVRWCLSLKLRSSSTYEAMYNSGLIKLPSQRTLRDYTHVIKASSGFSDEIDQMIIKEAKFDEIEEWQKHVVLIFDEMHIKEDLVFDKITGELKGFVDLGDINNHLIKFEEASNPEKQLPPLANSMLTFMVRGIFIYLQFPYAQFPCKNMTGDTLYPLAWETVQRLEMCGFKVLAAICDGASNNRHFIHMHNTAKGSLMHKTKNPFSRDPDRRFLYFVSDVPHLMKTARNCWANPKRKLWVSVVFYLLVS